MTQNVFSSRRKALLKTLGDGIAIIPTAPERVRNRDAYHPYRFDSHFWYLSGFPEPEAVLILIGGKTKKSILFCREKNEEREIWDGFRYGPEAACAHFGFDESYSISTLEAKLPDLIAKHETLWHAFGQDAPWDEKILAALNTVRTQVRAGKQPPTHMRDWRNAVDQMRLFKDAHEQKLMRQAGHIASAGHAAAMRACHAGVNEYALEAELSYSFRKQGADGHAYSPIVAGGANACVLHYVENNKALKDGALVLIDAGCELQGYASDITRTFPVNGKFTAEQKAVYEIVLAAQNAAIAHIKPNAPFIAYHDAAVRVLTQGLVDLKLLSGSLDGLIEKEAYKPFYMHRTGHWLGLDVHDAGEYKSGNDWVKLEAGMALTVEPGLYIRPSAKTPERFHNIGIRIEDDVFVTKNGCDVYTSAPKTVSEIEEAMRCERCD